MASKNRSFFTPYLLLLPTFVYLAFFTGYPIIYAIILGVSGDPPPITRIFEDIERLKDVVFYTFIIALVVPLQLVVSIFTSIFFLNRFKGREFILYLFVLPLAISEVAAALLWYTMLSSHGFLNKLLKSLGFINTPIYFFGYEFRDRTLLAIVLTEIWRATAIVFVIIYAGLQMVNRDYLEAADVFGLNFWQKLRYVILPLLKPSIQTALIIRTIFAFQIVGPIMVLGGGYIRTMATEVVYWYSMRLNPQVASAWGVLIGLIILALGALYIKFIKPIEV